MKGKQNQAILFFIHFFKSNLTSNIRDDTGVDCGTASVLTNINVHTLKSTDLCWANIKNPNLIPSHVGNKKKFTWIKTWLMPQLIGMT